MSSPSGLVVKLKSMELPAPPPLLPCESFELNDDGEVLRATKMTFVLIEGETARAQDFDLESDVIELTEEMKLEVFQACLAVGKLENQLML